MNESIYGIYVAILVHHFPYRMEEDGLIYTRYPDASWFRSTWFDSLFLNANATQPNQGRYK